MDLTNEPFLVSGKLSWESDGSDCKLPAYMASDLGSSHAPSEEESGNSYMVTIGASKWIQLPLVGGKLRPGVHHSPSLPHF